VLLLTSILLSCPTFAQTDFSGPWASLRLHEEGWEEPIGDYAGLPVNEAIRMRADTWTPSLLTLPEHQCKPHGADRIDNFLNLRVWKEVDLPTQKVIAYHLNVSWMNMHRVIYMDGHPHPPDYAAHSFMGFSTGAWDGNQLVVKTTHMKEQWLRRNGLPRSEKATLTERFMRHGDYLTWVFIVEDPAYLTEPYIRSRQFRYDPNQPPFDPYPCEPVEEVVRPRGEVPHHLPGTNPDLAQFPKQYGLPEEAARGGAETMYPEYQRWLRGLVDGTQRR
jgi:hypothetical protein